MEPQPSPSGSFTINQVLPNTPAAAAGLKAGDLITKIGDRSVRGMTVDEGVNRMQGEAGTPLRLTIRTGDAERELTITRATIALPVPILRLTFSAKSKNAFIQGWAAKEGDHFGEEQRTTYTR